MKKYKLNFKINEITGNNRIYSKDIIVKALEDKVHQGLFVVLTPDSIDEGLIDMRNVIGTVLEYHVLETGEIEVDVLPNKMLEAIGDCKLTISGIGCTEEDGKTIAPGFILTVLFVDMNSFGKDNAIK